LPQGIGLSPILTARFYGSPFRGCGLKQAYSRGSKTDGNCGNGNAQARLSASPAASKPGTPLSLMLLTANIFPD
jgi:hypothetical protein